MERSERELITELQDKREDTLIALWKAQIDAKNAILSYMGMGKDSVLSSVAEEMLTFAEESELDPKWFSTEAAKVATEVQGFSPNMTAGWFWRRLPVAETSEQFLNAAIHIIRARYPSSREHDDIIAGSFKKAAELTDNPGLSKTYTWLNEHRALLYEIHSKYWKGHDKKEAPTVLDPKELTSILETDIKSVRDRHVWIEILYGENSQTKADELKAYLESVGYEITFHFEGKPDAYEPGYPVLSRVKFGSLLHSLVTGFNFRFYNEAQEFVEGQQKTFKDRLEEVLTIPQKQNIDIYRRFLNPVTTELTLGTHWLDQYFVDNKIVYMEGVEVGFNIPEAVQLVDFSTNHLDTYNEVNSFLFRVNKFRDLISNQEIISPFIDSANGPVKEALTAFLHSDTASTLERPTKLKKLYEERAYRIYRPY